ncbi:hypothetical protein ACFLY5_00665, partial [Patescibacteria group bacterium]
MKIINKINLKLLALTTGFLFPLLTRAFMPTGGLGEKIGMLNEWNEGFVGGILGYIGSGVHSAINFLLRQIFILSGKILAMAGAILNFSIEKSIQDRDLYSEGIVEFGWGLCRDMTNFIFVFALIFIGIATILQIQTYGFRKLLVRIIIAALLVNFSATITLVIVDASNFVATEFMCAATYGECSPEIVSTEIANSLEFQTIIADKDGTVKPESLEKDKATIVYTFGTGLILLTAFIFLAGAFMFVIRAFVIMFLIIFAPFAFLGTALGMSSAKQWWQKLFNQALTAPIYFFLFYLVMAHLDQARQMADTSGKSFYGMITEKTMDNYDMAINFMVMGGLLFGILIVSNQLGAMGSAGAIKMIQGGARRMQGYAGRVVKAPPRLAGRAVRGAGGLAVAGAAAGAAKINLADRIMPITTKWNAGMKEKLKGLERGGTKAGQERIDKQVKRGLNLSPKEQSAYLMSLNTTARKDMMEKMSDRQRADMNQQAVAPGFRKIYDKLKKDMSPEEQEKTEKAEAVVQKKEDISKLKNPITSPAEMQKLHETLTGDDLKNLINDTTTDGKIAAAKYFQNLKTIGGLVNGTISEISDELNAMGNSAQASWIKTTA